MTRASFTEMHFSAENSVEKLMSRGQTSEVSFRDTCCQGRFQLVTWNLSNFFDTLTTPEDERYDVYCHMDEQFVASSEYKNDSTS